MGWDVHVYKGTVTIEGDGSLWLEKVTSDDELKNILFIKTSGYWRYNASIPGTGGYNLVPGGLEPRDICVHMPREEWEEFLEYFPLLKGVKVYRSTSSLEVGYHYSPGGSHEILVIKESGSHLYGRYYSGRNRMGELSSQNNKLLKYKHALEDVACVFEGVKDHVEARHGLRVFEEE